MNNEVMLIGFFKIFQLLLMLNFSRHEINPRISSFSSSKNFYSIYIQK